MRSETILRFTFRKFTELSPKFIRIFPKFVQFGWDRIFFQNESQNLGVRLLKPPAHDGAHQRVGDVHGDHMLGGLLLMVRQQLNRQNHLLGRGMVGFRWGRQPGPGPGPGSGAAVSSGPSGTTE